MLSKLESRKECMEQIELIQHWNYFCSLAERLDDTKHYIDHLFTYSSICFWAIISPASIISLCNPISLLSICVRIGVELSYLSEEEQYELHAVMDLEQCTPSLSQANRMKRISQSGKLDIDEIYSILEEEKPNQREQIKIRASTLEEYFPDDFTPKQKVELIERLVKEWHEKQIKDTERNR